jgi:hypothetical protein
MGARGNSRGLPRSIEPWASAVVAVPALDHAPRMLPFKRGKEHSR